MIPNDHPEAGRPPKDAPGDTSWIEMETMSDGPSAGMIIGVFFVALQLVALAWVVTR